MRASDISPIDKIKLWSWGGMAAFCIFFAIAFYNKVDSIGGKVDAVQIRISAHDQELKDLSSDIKEVKGNVTRILFHSQKETGATQDAAFNKFGPYPDYVSKIQKP